MTCVSGANPAQAVRCSKAGPKVSCLQIVTKRSASLSWSSKKHWKPFKLVRTHRKTRSGAVFDQGAIAVKLGW